MNIAVTTIRNYSRSIREEAEERGRALSLPFVPREGTLEDMRARCHEEGFLIYGKKQPSFWIGGEEYRFHLGTAVLRCEQMRRGHEDRLCRLLPEGTVSVLDATFGQGGDSTVLSWFLGDRGQVTALEKAFPSMKSDGQALLPLPIKKRRASQKRFAVSASFMRISAIFWRTQSPRALMSFTLIPCSVRR